MRNTADGYIRKFIAWAVTRRGHYLYRRKMVTFDGKLAAFRHEILWRDEWIDGDQRWNRPPWWRPFNAFLHCWRPQHSGEEFHDHPRWSVTIVLKGQLTERTPWNAKLLKPGSIVIRSRKAIHAFQVAPEWRGKTWTLFIVGRRNHRQNRYEIKGQSLNTAHGK
jgi:hypothetical protein